MKGWKQSLLSHAGQETFVKASLSSIPTYHMTMGLLPSSVITEMEKMRDFFWGPKPGGHHLYLKAWNSLKLPKLEGRLGFRDFKGASSSLLLKLAWKLYSELNFEWALLLKAKYFSTSSLSSSNPVPLHLPSGEVFSIHSLLELLIQHLCWFIVSGANVQIFEDRWISTLLGLLPKPPAWDKSRLFVKDLIKSPLERWDSALIRQAFDDDTTSAILSTPIQL